MNFLYKTNNLNSKKSLKYIIITFTGIVAMIGSYLFIFIVEHSLINFYNKKKKFMQNTR